MCARKIILDLNTCLMRYKEAIKLYAQLATVLAVFFSAGALILNWNASKLQRGSIQASLFNDTSAIINKLTNEWPKLKTYEEKKKWYERLFAAFEYFAFFANHNYLSDDMKEYYVSGMEVYCSRLEKKYPDLLKYYKNLPEEQFYEFKKFYKAMTGKDTPF